MIRAFIATAIVLSSAANAAIARAESPGTLGLLSTNKLTAEVRRTTGSIPLRLLEPTATALELRDWKQISTWIQLTGGVTTRSSDTDLGTQVGVEWSLKVGLTPNEVKEYRDAAIVGFAGSLAVAFRTVSWSGPFYGAILILAGGELGAGGGHWWSDTARLTFFGGARMVTAQKYGSGALELTYILAPFEFGGTPDSIRSRRVEHRIGLTAAVDAVGFGIWFYGIQHSVRFGDETNYVSVGGTALGGSVELRW